MLTDSEYHTSRDTNDSTTTTQHLAFITALSRHPPSLRVFRIVSETAFLLLCIAFALYIWEHNSGIRGHVGELLFGQRVAHGVFENAAFVVYKRHRRDGGIRGLVDSSRRRRRRSSDREKQQLGQDGVLPSSDGDENDIELNNFDDVKSNGMTNDSSSSWEKISASPSGDSPLKVESGRSTAEERYRDNNIDGSDQNTDDNANEHNAIIHNPTPSSPQNTISTKQSSSQPSPHSSIPPPSISVLGAALDISIVTCMFLIFFTVSSAEGGRYIDRAGRMGLRKKEEEGRGEFDDDAAAPPGEPISYLAFFANVAAPLFPLGLFIISLFLVVVPWRKRKVLWSIVSLTMGAPFYEVTFRDGFIGDIITSIVRPLQDLVFTLFFLPLGLHAWWSSHAYTMDAAAIPIERSWLVHTVLLPACTLSPLWWRFCQNLRQCFDAKQRWPYLGNALKYMAAAEVTTFGMFDPSVKKHPVWIACFFVATVYQVWWDVFMDWGLLERDVGYYGDRSGICWWWPYSLRTKRLYKRRWVYHVIFCINFFLRFVGMITLIPPVHLSRTTGLIVNTYNPDFQLFVGSLAACAEILRRTIWALLRLEWEVIKTSEEKKKSVISGVQRGTDATTTGGEKLSLLEEEDMKPMPIASSSTGWRGYQVPWPLLKRSAYKTSLSDMSDLNDIQILSELCVWATVFSGIAIIAAAHREVL